MSTVLVVDDSEIERRMAAALLTDRGELAVVEAGCASQALMLLQLAPIDLVLTDLRMPGVDGLELLQKCKAAEPLTPVIVMTGYGSEDLAVQALQTGADGYIRKARLTQELVSIVDRLLRTSREHRVLASALGFLRRQHVTFELDNTPARVSSVVRHLADQCAQFGLIDERERVRLSVALEEAMHNAIIHGNLEVGSELREQSDGSYETLIGLRRRLEKYSSRRVHLSCDLTPDEARIVIRDEGPGFDVGSIPDPRDPERMMLASGRGLLLMRTFMDDVSYNAQGNEVTLVKRRSRLPLFAASDPLEAEELVACEA